MTPADPQTKAGAIQIPCIHDLVEEQARKRPEGVALTSGNSTLTYGELTRLARQLSSRLVAWAVPRNSVVAIAASRSVELIVALLGVLEAGCGYMVLDPELPRARAGRLLADARPALVLAEQALLGKLPRSGVEILPLEVEPTSPGLETRLAPLPSAHPDQLAYVSYTSGSTGEPKGVAITHRGVTRLVRNSDWAGFGPDDVFLQLAPVAFDASTFEIWAALANGSRLVVYPQGPVTAERLGELVQRQCVTVLSLVAGLFHKIADSHLDVFRGVQHLIAGGDAVSSAHAAAVLAAYPGIRFTHAYGPTENTTFTTVCAIEETARTARLSIGRPIRGTGVAILDDKLRPVPAGTAGELYIAGHGLAQGYLHRPAATAERFVPNLLDDLPGSRLYRTGDIARWREDGMIDFLGRADTQLKVQGYRVEAGEIENRLREDPRVRDAVVLSRISTGNGRELVAYIVPAYEIKDAKGEAARLREWLGRMLPTHMIPRAFLSVSAFPLTVNGKVDRDALARDPRVVELGRRGAEQPGTPLERTVADAWDLVLGTQTGVDENFFEAGGNSLLLMTLRARLSQVLGHRIPTVALLDNPTIRLQALFLAGGQKPGPDGGRRPGQDQQLPDGEQDGQHPPRTRQTLRERSRRRVSE